MKSDNTRFENLDIIDHLKTVTEYRSLYEGIGLYEGIVGTILKNLEVYKKQGKITLTSLDLNCNRNSVWLLFISVEVYLLHERKQKKRRLKNFLLLVNDVFFSESAWIKLLEQIGMMNELHIQIPKINEQVIIINSLMCDQSVWECRPSVT